MRATRHNGRSGSHGTYNVKHNDRNFDVKNSDHIDEVRTHDKKEYASELLDAGVTKEDLRTMIVTNPAKLLAR